MFERLNFFKKQGEDEWEDIENETEKDRTVKHKEIGDLEEPTYRLIEQLKPMIKEGKFELIIGDDISGRIPTLVMDKVIKWFYTKSGFKLPQTIFITGSREVGGAALVEKKDQMKEYILKFGDIKHVLVVSDIVRTGSALRPLLEVLNELNIGYDVAAMDHYPGVLEDPLFHGRIYGGKGSDDLVRKVGSFGQGLMQDEHKYLHTRSTKKIAMEFGARRSSRTGVSLDPDSYNDDQEKINDTRYDARSVADRVISRYESQEKNEQ